MLGECTQEDDLELRLPGTVLTHLVLIASDNDVLSMIMILQAVNRAGGQIVTMFSAVRAGTMEHRVRICGINPTAARSLCANLAQMQMVRFVNVEHHLQRLSRRAISRAVLQLQQQESGPIAKSIRSSEIIATTQDTFTR